MSADIIEARELATGDTVLWYEAGLNPRPSTRTITVLESSSMAWHPTDDPDNLLTELTGVVWFVADGESSTSIHYAPVDAKVTRLGQAE